jgi:hypothetical protein
VKYSEVVGTLRYGPTERREKNMEKRHAHDDAELQPLLFFQAVLIKK